MFLKFVDEWWDGLIGIPKALNSLGDLLQVSQVQQAAIHISPSGFCK